MSPLQSFRVLALATTIVGAAIPASADDGQHRVLTTTATISLTIAPSAVIRVRSNQWGIQQLSGTVNGGSALAEMGVNYTVRDSRGERQFATLPAAQAAIAESQLRGERTIDVTFVF